MLTKEFVLSGNAMFVVKVPQSYQDKHKAKPLYTFKVEEVIKDEIYKISLLGGLNNGITYEAMGLLYAGSASIGITGKYKDWMQPVILARHAILAAWQGRNTDVNGWSVTEVKPAKDVVHYGSPIVSTADIVRNAGMEADVYGDPSDYWEEQAEAEFT